jgi:hypothetical protein
MKSFILFLLATSASTILAMPAPQPAHAAMQPRASENAAASDGEKVRRIISSIIFNFQLYSPDL